MKTLRRWEIFLLILIAVVLIGSLVYLTEIQSQPVAASDVMVRALGWCNYKGYQSLTPNSTSASALTQTSMTTKTVIAWVTCETATIRYRMDGTSPTTSEGHQIVAGGNKTLIGRHQIDNFKAISASVYGTLRVSYGE